MPTLPTPLTRLLNPPARHSDTVRIAPAALRKRVLANVRSEAPARRSSLGIGPVVAVALGIAAVLALSLFPLGASQPRTMRATLRVAGHRAELQLAGMPEPPVGEVYEVWLDRGGAHPQPTDVLFTVTSAGYATVSVPGGLRGVRGIYVTPEPLGGSEVPTGPVVLHVTAPRSV